jgi:putative membrane protein
MRKMLMRLHLFPVSTLALTVISGAAFAQNAEGYNRSEYFHGPGMMWGGYGGYGMFLGPLFMIVLLIAIVAGVIYLLRAFGGGNLGLAAGTSGVRSLDILKERYARGEIDSKEFEERKRMLSDG